MQNFLRMEAVCRTCLRTTSNLLPLYNNQALMDKIETISLIQIDTSDLFPSGICEECTRNVEKLYNFRLVIINNDKDLKERITTISEQGHGDNNVLNDPSDNDDPSDDPLEDPLSSESLQKTLNKLKECRCKICDRTFSSRFKLYNHRRTNHVARGVCSVCGIVVRSDNMSKHVQSHSAGPAKCPHCDKQYKNAESLRGHLQVHKGMIFTCEICGKQTRAKSEYRRHMRSHVNPEHRKTVCKICGKKVRDMKKHIQSHTGERPHKCDYCQRGFTSSYALKVHTRQHTNEKPYHCEFCSLSFPQKVSLTTHLRSKHNKKS